MKLLGSELNIRHEVDRDIFTPEEIIAAGFVHVPWITFVTDKNNTLYNHAYCDEEDILNGKYPMVIRTLKLKARYDHSWDDEMKKMAKEMMVTELKMNGYVFVHNFRITPFAPEMDYSNCCYDPGVLVRASKQKQPV